MILEATHRTRYEYLTPAVDSYNEMRLAPLTDSSQTCLDFRLEVSPPAQVFAYEDMGGTVHHFGLREPHRSLEIVATTRVETLCANPYEGLAIGEDDWSFYSQEDIRQANIEYLVESPYVALVSGVESIAAEARGRTKGVVSFLIDLNRHINRLLHYDSDATHVHTTVQEVLDLGAGVCQDYTHLMIACCRSQGVPTRYVSGYLYGGEGIRGEGATHAWLECRLPNGHWLALDPTNNLLANDHHIRVHTGRDYGDVSPTRGIYMGPPALPLDVSVRVKAVSLAGV